MRKAAIMKKALWGMMGCLLALCACNETPSSYRVEGVLQDSTFDGRTIYIRQRDNRTYIDSTRVEGNRFVFQGSIDTAVICEVYLGRNEYSLFILENGHITLDLYDHLAPQGSPMNEQMASILKTINSLEETYMARLDSFNRSYWAKEGLKEPRSVAEIPEEILNKQLVLLQTPWEQTEDSIRNDLLTHHNNDALGQLILYAGLLPYDVNEQMKILDQLGPWVKSRKDIQRKIKTLKAQEKTAPGQPYFDIEGRDVEGKEIALSDFLGKGNYVLVDMWASWCGPCKQEIPNLAHLHNKYKDHGLTVVGLFVWDKEKNLKKSVEKEKITWPQIFDAEDVARKAYGVDGIPHIMLISPDGIILERNLRGKNMIATIDKLLQNKP